MRSICALATLVAIAWVAGAAHGATPFHMQVTGTGTYNGGTDELSVSAKQNNQGFSGHIVYFQNGVEYDGDVSQGCMLNVGRFAIVVGLLQASQQTPTATYLAGFVQDNGPSKHGSPDRAFATVLPSPDGQALCAAVLAGPILTQPLDSGNFTVKLD